jgi:hypothetical protein
MKKEGQFRSCDTKEEKVAGPSSEYFKYVLPHTTHLISKLVRQNSAYTPDYFNRERHIAAHTSLEKAQVFK